MVNNIYQHLLKYEPTNKKKFIFYLLFWCIVMMIMREPKLVTNPRIWAEEGTIFFSWAKCHNFIENFSTSLIGYYTLFNFSVAYLQTLVPLKFIPLVSTFSGFTIQLIPLLIILFTQHQFWDTPIKKTFISLIYILVIPPELMFNTTNSHFFFGLIAFLILVTDAYSISKFAKWAFRFLLIIGCLSGPSACFTAPLFLLKMVKKPFKEHTIQCIIVLLFSIIQFAVVVYSILYENKYGRLHIYDTSVTISAFFRDNFGCNFDLFGKNDKKNIAIIISFLSLIIMFAHKRDKQYHYFILSFFITGFLSTLGSLNMAGDIRYSFIPTFILISIFINDVFEKSSNASGMKSKIAQFILLLFFTSNILSFKTTMNTVYSDDFPNFKEEIEKWKLDNNYNIQVHPTTKFLIWEIDQMHTLKKEDLKFSKPVIQNK
jgi:hypothetical protein